ncbi:MAG: chemotaxis protein CheR [Alphaproteobacteria bacterium]|nr:chemotaxis protein CheR [Alphaproteobacteria bacterium]
MKSDEFELLSRLVKERSRLVLTKDKAYLLESRLLPVARKHGVKGLEELVVAVRAKPDGPVARDIVEAMTTNESLFFRDVKPFDQFRNLVLPKLLLARAARRTIRIWSAACSSGQEPYSLAMILDELQAKIAGWRIEIVATDLSNEILDRARAGVYSQFEVQRGLPVQYLIKHFKQNGDKWHISDKLKSMVTYRTFNLLDSMSVLGQFDIVFCRNVLIYFDQATKGRVLASMAQLLPADGVLYLGGAETVLGVSDRFEPLPGERGIYRPVPPSAPLQLKGAVG